MPPPIPPGVEAYPVAPHIHTTVTDEPEREGWTQPEPADFDEHADTAIALTQPEAS